MDEMFRINCRSYSGFDYYHKQGVCDAFPYDRALEHVANGYCEADVYLHRIRFEPLI